MRFFTPERLFGLQERADEHKFRAALDDWEDAASAYREQLNRVQKSLPPALRHLVETVALHDAWVIDISQGQRSRFTIILQPESDPARQVVLAYSLVEPVEIIEDALSPLARSRPVQWLYDELEIASTDNNGSAASRADGHTFAHSILLSNGWELKVRFRNVTITRPVSLLRRRVEDRAAQETVSRSA